MAIRPMYIQDFINGGHEDAAVIVEDYYKSLEVLKDSVTDTREGFVLYAHGWADGSHRGFKKAKGQ